MHLFKVGYTVDERQLSNAFSCDEATEAANKLETIDTRRCQVNADHGTRRALSE
jgi:hypothetical protein